MTFMKYRHAFTGKRIWQCFFFTGLLAFCLSSCSTLKSDLTVQPGTRFELGGNRNGSFTVQLRNRGDVPVTITERKANGQRVELGLFSPGDQQTVRFSAGSAALIDNATARPARLLLTVTGDKGLSMSQRSD